jgi:NAD(P)-dependent dehydrogenase (short-subunit alcohol dehydrogenase family)
MSKIVFISGISSGFGKETARILSSNGFRVYGTVRKDTEYLEGVNYIRMDLTDTASISSAVNFVVSKEGRIDILINNAGMHTGGPAETLPAEYVRLQMDTNFIGMVSLTREILPHMRRQGGGMIINFSSIGGIMGLPFQAYYSAGKFAIEGFSEALRMEVRKFNIKIVVINPGDFNTNNTLNRRSFLSSLNTEDPYDVHYKNALEIIEKDETNGWKPKILAGKILKIIQKDNPRHRYIIASPEQKLAVLLKRILPDKLFEKILTSHYGLN